MSLGPLDGRVSTAGSDPPGGDARFESCNCATISIAKSPESAAKSKNTIQIKQGWKEVKMEGAEAV